MWEKVLLLSMEKVKITCLNDIISISGSIDTVCYRVFCEDCTIILWLYMDELIVGD